MLRERSLETRMTRAECLLEKGDVRGRGDVGRVGPDSSYVHSQGPSWWPSLLLMGTHSRKEVLFISM
jgi:hypothetical protein